ncbi:OmpA family protein [Telluribacter sp.]|jgi:outer membrane protein OmpA-like peptidoglycan-associated protein|uniref:OmpA family protein n=1 Tax=Telluribacter sp. TaxID=1978767 RepID=UPI002E0EBD39|nr:OmpA family protein [Telluribacter sp.]
MPIAVLFSALLVLFAPWVVAGQRLAGKRLSGQDVARQSVAMDSSGTATVSLKAFDLATLQPIPAQFLLREQKTGRQTRRLSTTAELEIKLLFAVTDSLLLLVSAPGYQPRRESHWVDTLTSLNNQYSFWIFLAPDIQKKAPIAEVAEARFDNLKAGETIRLDRVYFDQSSYVLRSESYPQLDQLVAALKKNRNLKIEIAGHTDNVGNVRLNQYLSENRARVIANYLRSKGVASSRLVPKGYGPSRPLTDNDTEENRAQNRRVEFRVLEVPNE